MLRDTSITPRAQRDFVDLHVRIMVVPIVCLDIARDTKSTGDILIEIVLLPNSGAASTLAQDILPHSCTRFCPKTAERHDVKFLLDSGIAVEENRIYLRTQTCVEPSRSGCYALP